MLVEHYAQWRKATVEEIFNKSLCKLIELHTNRDKTYDKYGLVDMTHPHNIALGNNGYLVVPRPLFDAFHTHGKCDAALRAHPTICTDAEQTRQLIGEMLVETVRSMTKAIVLRQYKIDTYNGNRFVGDADSAAFCEAYEILEHSRARVSMVRTW